jgi:hypothetical protein
MKLEGLHSQIASLEYHERHSASSLVANGTTESLIELAQILSWIAATFRRPKRGDLATLLPRPKKLTLMRSSLLEYMV